MKTMFRNTQSEFIKIQDVEVILKSFKQVMEISFDGKFYEVTFGDDYQNSTVKFVIENNVVTSQELINVSGDSE